MSKLKLTFACGPYDRMEALQYNRIEVEGIDLNYLEIQAPREIFDRMVGDRAFDMSELSLAEHVGMTSKGNSPFVARVSVQGFPPRLYLHQQQLGHQGAERPGRQAHRCSPLHHYRRDLDSR
jgi:4,5-dihydroxyphthalate decarboxylase